MKINKHFYFWVLSFSAIIGLILPILIQDGMFIDGVLYTSVGKNLANGIGSFWFLEFSQLGFADNITFHEQPPLVFAIQSLFFKFLGDSIYVERVYSFITACFNAYLISILWKLITRDYGSLNKMAWLPVLLWIITPVCFWSFQNNVMENTMGIFTLSSIYFCYKALYTHKRTYLNLLFAGIFIFLASFSKGVPGLFPIVFFGIYWIVTQQLSFYKMLSFSLVIVFVPTIIYTLMLLDEEAYRSLSIYFSERLIGRIGSSPTVGNRFYTLYRLVSELLPALIITIILLVTYKIKYINNKIDSSYNKKIILLIIIGLSGSLPLMLTMVQKGFYFSHSIPFFALGLSLLIAPGLLNFIDRINLNKIPFKTFKVFSIILLITTIIISLLQIGKTSRNNDLLDDIYQIGEIVPQYTMITIDKSMWNKWDMQCYFVRHFNISVDPNNLHEYYLINKSITIPLPAEYVKMQVNLNEFELYRKIN